MAVVRYAAVWRHASGLARDQVVNTFHVNQTTLEPNLLGVRDAITAFYQVTPTGGVRPVSAYLSDLLLDYRVKAYDVTTLPSGSPIMDQGPFVRATAATLNDNMPSEVAACISYQGTPTGGLIQPRRRGRIYIGPFNTSARNTATGQTHTPSLQMLTDFRLAYSKLTADCDPYGELVVYSRPFAGRFGAVKDNGQPKPNLPARPGTTVDITQVWTDNAFDTQRRRGERATAKVLITSTG